MLRDWISASASTGGRAPTIFSHFIMPRTRRSQPVPASAMPGSAPAPPAGPDPPATLSQDHPQPPKRRTVATNSLAIDSMGGQLYTMSQILERISDRVGVDSSPVPAPAVPVTQATPAPAPTPPQVHSATCPPDFISRPVTPFQDPQAWLYPPHPSRVRHATEGQMFDSVNNSSFPMTQNPGIPAASYHPAYPPHHPQSDPLSAATASRPRFDFPATLQDLEEGGDIDSTVTQLLTHTLAPLAAVSGRKIHACSFVKRGSKKTRTNLGELTLAEYNTGFIKLMNSSKVAPTDKPFMFRHLGQLNEDAMHYQWSGVRRWSEEVWP